jgi:cold shock CspA family protein
MVLARPDAATLTGTVKTLMPHRGFGFVVGRDGQDYFFHRSDAADFDALTIGVVVRFVPTDSAKGPRAAAVTRI